MLIDVQMPLARQAIMTGINQTLLLAISMLGIAAIMGAGGLGSVLYRALSRQSAADAAASGLAFFLVAVVLDRISQTEAGGGGGLLRRMRLAWMHRREPEKLLASSERRRLQHRVRGFRAGKGASLKSGLENSPEGVVAGCRRDCDTIVAVLLVWNADAGFMSAYGRRVDENLAGQSFSGLSASGGSWYGILALSLAALVIAAVLTLPGRGPRISDARRCADRFAGIAGDDDELSPRLSTSRLASPTLGAGVYLALAGAIMASLGALIWIISAPCSPQHPLNSKIGWSRMFGGTAAVVVILVGALSGWSFDRRTDQVISAETESQDRSTRQAGGGRAGERRGHRHRGRLTQRPSERQ